MMTDLWEVMPEIEAGGTSFRVIGARLEAFATRTNFNQPEGVARLIDIMKKLGVTAELERQGAASGDIIQIGPHQFPWP